MSLLDEQIDLAQVDYADVEGYLVGVCHIPIILQLEYQWNIDLTPTL
jgi:hypothetical protein